MIVLCGIFCTSIGYAQMAYPKVTTHTDGPVIVSRDGTSGVASSAIHPNWTKTPSHDDASSDNRVSAKLQVAKTDASTEKYSFSQWSTIEGLCKSPWRLPTQREIMLIYAMGGAVEDVYRVDYSVPSWRNPPVTKTPLYEISGFTPLPTKSYWTATLNSATGTSYWVLTVGVSPTISSYGSGSPSAYVRCVKDL